MNPPILFLGLSKEEKNIILSIKHKENQFMPVLENIYNAIKDNNIYNINISTFYNPVENISGVLIQKIITKEKR